MSNKEDSQPATVMPAKIRFAEGFREDVLVFSRCSESDTVLTNLPVDSVPAALSSLCQNIAEKALLAYVIASGGSVEYAHLDYSIEKMRRLAREFAAEFMQPLKDDGVTQVIQLTDMGIWFHRHARYGWSRSISNPPGTEYG